MGVPHGTPHIIHSNGIFHYKPSILGLILTQLPAVVLLPVPHGGWYYERDAPWLADDIWQAGDFHEVFKDDGNFMQLPLLFRYSWSNYIDLFSFWDLFATCHSCAFSLSHLVSTIECFRATIASAASNLGGWCWFLECILDKTCQVLLVFVHPPAGFLQAISNALSSRTSWNCCIFFLDYVLHSSWGGRNMEKLFVDLLMISP